MQFHQEDDNRIKSYLLGAASAEEAEQLEERIFEDGNFARQLRVVEEELIDDYVSGRLTEDEYTRFERYFLALHQLPDETGQRAGQTNTQREQLLLMKAMKKYAAKANKSSHASAPENAFSLLSQVRLLFSGWWQAPVFVALLVVVGFLSWRVFFYQSETDKGLALLSRAYADQRPLEARISGFGYSPFIVTKGDSKEKGDARTRNLAERILLEAAERESDAASAHALGKLYLAKREFDQAIEQFELALRAAPGNAQLHNDLGVALFEKGKLERLDTQTGKGEVTLAKSLEQMSKALELNAALSDARFNRALLYQALGLTNQARAEWEKYLETDSTSPWAEEARQNLKLLAEGNKKISQTNEQLYQDFWRAFQTKDDARASQTFSLGYNYSGNWIVWKLLEGFLAAKLNNLEAKENLRALAYIGKLVAEKTGDRLAADLARHYQQARPDQLLLLAQARKLMKEGFELYQAAKNEPAIERYTQAKQLFEQTGNTSEMLLADALMGHSYHMRSDPQRSREIFTHLVPRCAEKRYYWMQAHALCGIANAHESASEFSQAIEAVLAARKLAERLSDVAGSVRCLSLLGNYYYTLGKHAENLRLSMQGRELCQQLPTDVARQSGFYMLAGLSLTALGLYDAALSHQQELLKLGEGVKMPRLFARLYVQMGRSYAGLKKYNEALATTQRGIAIGRELQSDKTGRELMAYGNLTLGYIHHDVGQDADALEAFRQVIDFHQPDERQIFLYRAYKGRLMTLIRQGSKTAQTELENVMALYEKYREQIREESNRNTFYHNEQDIYDIAIEFAQTRLNDQRRAFDYSELSRARSLLDASRRSRKLIAEAELPDLSFAGTTHPAGYDSLRQRLPEQIQVLEYAALKDKLLIWLITKEAIACEVVAVSLADLTDRVNRYLALLNQPAGSSTAEGQKLGMELYELLIQPFATKLNPKKQLCIVPDKVLTQLPLGALVARGSGRFLVEDYTLNYASSANLLLYSTEQAQAKAGVATEHLLAVGNPRFDRQTFADLADLPPAAQEANAVASAYVAPTVLIGTHASKNDVLRELERSDVAHLAMHYLPNERSPMLSQLPLAATSGGQAGQADSVLRVYEIYRLNALRPRLVVLSACQTMAEGYYSGEGALGVSRPFQAAGIPLVVASLWPVEAKATAELMTEFHRLRKQAHRSTAAALAESQRKLLQSGGQYRSPYYWAAFITVGGYSEY
jgi:CHAT domain-containing protein